jgi:hypothetical protein
LSAGKGQVEEEERPHEPGGCWSTLSAWVEVSGEVPDLLSHERYEVISYLVRQETYVRESQLILMRVLLALLRPQLGHEREVKHPLRRGVYVHAGGFEVVVRWSLYDTGPVFPMMDGTGSS